MCIKRIASNQNLDSVLKSFSYGKFQSVNTPLIEGGFEGLRNGCTCRNAVLALTGYILQHLLHSRKFDQALVGNDHVDKYRFHFIPLNSSVKENLVSDRL